MRITHQMLSRNYLSRMNTNLSNLTKSNERMSSQRAFNKGYENVSDAGKALKMRKLLADNERYQTNIRDLQGRASSAEDGIRTVNSLLIKAQDRMVEGLNGTISESDRQKIASELERLQEEVFQIMNTQYSGRYLYNAAGNLDGSPPFTKGASGELIFNGTPVDDMVLNTATGRPSLDNGGVLEEIRYNGSNYVDIGFNFALSGDKTDPNTAFKDSYSGVEAFGYGKNADGTPVNAYSLLGRMVTDLRNNNIDGLEKDLNGISDSMGFLLTSITDIGARSTLLEDTFSRLENEYIVLAETQGKLEGIDLSEEAIYNKSHEMSWMVTLQLGSKILPQTIFDFLR